MNDHQHQTFKRIARALESIAHDLGVRKKEGQHEPDGICDRVGCEEPVHAWYANKALCSEHDDPKPRFDGIIPAGKQWCEDCGYSPRHCVCKSEE